MPQSSSGISSSPLNASKLTLSLEASSLFYSAEDKFFVQPIGGSAQETDRGVRDIDIRSADYVTVETFRGFKNPIVCLTGWELG